MFDVVKRTRRPRLTRPVCLPLPPGQVANSVGVFADGTVLATVLTRPGTAIADFVTGRVTGGVWQWRIVAADFMPDNIHWNAGHLLVTGRRLDEPACGGLRKVIDGAVDGTLCHRGWTVGALNVAARRIETMAEGPPQPGFNGVSAAAIAGGELWTDLAAVKAHFAVPATGAFVRALSGMAAGSPEIKIFNAEDVTSALRR